MARRKNGKEVRSRQSSGGWRGTGGDRGEITIPSTFLVSHKWPSLIYYSYPYKLPEYCKLKCWSRINSFCSVALRHTFHRRHHQRDGGAGPFAEKQPWVIFQWYNHQNTAAAPHTTELWHTWSPPHSRLSLSLLPHMFSFTPQSPAGSVHRAQC